MQNRALPLTFSLALSCLCFAGLPGCGEAEKAPEYSAWSVVNDAFSAELYDAAARQRNFSPDALNALALLNLVGQERYVFLYIADLRRIDDQTRKGKVAFSVDSWPMTLGFTVTATAQGPWQISAVDTPESQKRLLDLISEDGLPSAPTARPWKGGLAGRDAVGRPTASVLLLADGERLEIDGVPVAPKDKAQQVRALKDALAMRTRLANEAHAGYTPQVAIAMPRQAQASLLPTLIALATEAGANEALLVVRGPGGRPALYPLARITNVEGNTPPPVIEAVEAPEGLTLTLGEKVVQVPRKGPNIDRDMLRRALDAMLFPETPEEDEGAEGDAQAVETPEPAGLRLRPWSSGRHWHTVAVLDAVRAAAPGLPILVGVQ
ncbi:MAG: hypothetical protein ACE366_29620 [Bradymonadia bacterium]